MVDPTWDDITSPSRSRSFDLPIPYVFTGVNDFTAEVQRTPRVKIWEVEGEVPERRRITLVRAGERYLCALGVSSPKSLGFLVSGFMRIPGQLLLVYLRVCRRIMKDCCEPLRGLQLHGCF